jgi:hypothetical protein
MYSITGARHVTRQNQGQCGCLGLCSFSSSSGSSLRCRGRQPQPRQACGDRRSRPGKGGILAAVQHTGRKVLRVRAHHHNPAGTTGSRNRPAKEGLAVVFQLGLGRAAQPRGAAAGQDYCVEFHTPSVVPGRLRGGLRKQERIPRRRGLLQFLDLPDGAYGRPRDEPQLPAHFSRRVVSLDVIAAEAGRHEVLP